MMIYRTDHGLAYHIYEWSNNYITYIDICHYPWENVGPYILFFQIFRIRIIWFLMIKFYTREIQINISHFFGYDSFSFFCSLLMISKYYSVYAVWYIISRYFVKNIISYHIILISWGHWRIHNFTFRNL